MVKINAPKQPPQKRRAGDISKEEEENKEVSNLELFKFMEEMRAENKHGLMSLNSELSTQIATMQTSLSAMQHSIGEVESKVKLSNKKVEESLKLAYQNKAAINMLFQCKLQNKIDIVGANLDMSLQGTELIAEVKQLVESFGIAINNQDIKHAYQRQIKKTGALVVVVEFINLDTKIRVLKDKRQANNDRKIYFDNSLTPQNRYLMIKAREVAKERNFRVFMNGDQIHVKKDDQTKLVINDDCDIETIKSWASNQPATNQTPEATRGGMATTTSQDIQSTSQSQDIQSSSQQQA
jgi:hypothetical protein